MKEDRQIYRKETHPWIELRSSKGPVRHVAWGGPKSIEKSKKGVVEYILFELKKEFWSDPLAKEVYEEIKGSEDPFNKVYFLTDKRLPESEEPMAREVEESHKSVAARLDEINAELAARAKAYRESVKELMKQRERYTEAYFDLDRKLEDYVQNGYRKGA